MRIDTKRYGLSNNEILKINEENQTKYNVYGAMLNCYILGHGSGHSP